MSVPTVQFVGSVINPHTGHEYKVHRAPPPPPPLRPDALPVRSAGVEPKITELYERRVRLAPSRRGCERCCYTGVLAGFGLGKSVDANDRACECSPMKSEGPSEWEIAGRCELLHEGDVLGWSATYEFVLAWKGEQRIGFIVADYGEGPGRQEGTAIGRLLDYKVFGCVSITNESVRQQWGDARMIHTIAVHGERCRDMVVARLLIALRDGSVKP